MRVTRQTGASKARWTKEQIATLLKLAHEGLEWKVVGERMGRTHDAVRLKFEKINGGPRGKVNADRS